MSLPLECSVVVTTKDRSPVLRGALEALIQQDVAADRFEIIVVDNGSTDDTKGLVESFCARWPHVRYVFEPVPGPASGRNAGIRIAKGRILAFCDDDVRVVVHWMRSLLNAFGEHPDTDACAGRILPRWQGEPPQWLTRDHWVGPLALQDYGDKPFFLDSSHPLALAAANLAIRREALDAIGAFSPAFQRAEDTELLVRLWRAGSHCLYVPEMLSFAEVEPERLTKAYHRSWHRANGKWTAAMQWAEAVDRGGRLLATPLQGPALYGVPAFILREFLTVAWRWTRATALRRRDEALMREYRLRYLSGYIRSRAHTYVAGPHPSPAREIGAFLAALWRRKVKRGPASAAADREAPPARDRQREPGT